MRLGKHPLSTIEWIGYRGGFYVGSYVSRFKRTVVYAKIQTVG
jgi:hypothetical protein